MIGTLLSLVGLWVLLAALWAAVWPLFSSPPAPPADADVERRDLEAEKARLLQELHELELDYATGKLSEEDHAAIESRLKARAVDVMRRLDALGGTPAETPPARADPTSG